MITSNPVVGKTYLMHGKPCVVLCLTDSDTNVVYSTGSDSYRTYSVDSFKYYASEIPEANEPTIIQKLHGLIGYVQNGTDRLIEIYQNEDTMMYYIRCTYNNNNWGVAGTSLEEAINKAYESYGEKI